MIMLTGLFNRKTELEVKILCLCNCPGDSTRTLFVLT